MLDQSIKTVSKYIIDFAEEVDRSLEDGWQFKDLFNFTDEAFAAPNAIQAWPTATKLIKAGLSIEDRKEWNDFIETELNIPHEDAELKAKAIIDLLLNADKNLRIILKKKAA